MNGPGMADVYQMDPNMSADMGMDRYKLFVANIPPTCSENDLRQLFSPYGNVLDCVVLRDKMMGVSKNSAFVIFGSKDAGDAAIANLHDKYQFQGVSHKLIVRFAIAKADEVQKVAEWKLYIGMLSRQTDDDEVRRLFEPYGIINEVHVIRSPKTGQSKGCAFVKYGTRDEAIRAITALHDKYKDKDAPGKLQVRLAHTKEERTNYLTSLGVVPGMPRGGMGMGGMGMGGMGMGGMGQMSSQSPPSSSGAGRANSGQSGGGSGQGGDNYARFYAAATADAAQQHFSNQQPFPAGALQAAYAQYAQYQPYQFQ